MDELKSCPFCGGKATPYPVTTYTSGGDWCVGYDFKIKCVNCGLTLPNRYEIRFRFKDDGEISIEKDDRGKAVEQWNRRANDADNS